MQTALIWRQCGLWVLTRLVYLLVLMLAVSSPDEKAANSAWHVQPVVIILCATFGAVDIRRRGERLLLGNLGISQHRVAGLLAAPPLVAEVLVAVAGSV
jgi:hypothetical protein